MATVEITFERALRIWWSYTWRSIALLAPIFILMMYFLPAAPVTAPGGPAPDPMADSQANPLLLAAILAINIAMQVQALRWMLKTKWRDFRLEAVADEGASKP